jgi:hypothetical protein
MVARLYPGDAVGGAPSYTGRALRQSQSPFLAGATTARPLGALSGVRPGTPSSTVTATSTTWTVNPFAGVIDLQTAAIAGPYTFAFDAAVTGTVTAAGASARIDSLSVRVNDGAESDGTTVAPFVEIVPTVGTSVAPAVPARSFVIALINVPATGGGSPTVTWNAPYAVAAGATVPFNTLAQLLLWTTATLWQPAIVLATGTKYSWTGTAWAPFAPFADLNTFVGKAIPNNTVVTLGGTAPDYAWTEAADTYSWHDPVTNPTRITPTVAGQYLVVLTVSWASQGVGVRFGLIGLNGSYQNQRRQVVSAPVDGNGTAFVTQVIAMNGTTDYLEAQAFQSSGAALNVFAQMTVALMPA